MFLFVHTFYVLLILCFFELLSVFTLLLILYFLDFPRLPLQLQCPYHQYKVLSHHSLLEHFQVFLKLFISVACYKIQPLSRVCLETFDFESFGFCLVQFFRNLVVRFIFFTFWPFY